MRVRGRVWVRVMVRVRVRVGVRVRARVRVGARVGVRAKVRLRAWGHHLLLGHCAVLHPLAQERALDGDLRLEDSHGYGALSHWRARGLLGDDVLAPEKVRDRVGVEVRVRVRDGLGLGWG